MKQFIWTYLAILTGSVFGAKNEISLVSPTFSRAIESKDTRILEQVIEDILECFRKVLSAGLPEHGIPSFDPLTIPEINIDLDSLGIPEATGNLNFKNLVLDGTMGFQATHIKGSALIIGGLGAKIEITLLFDEINFQSDYNGDLEVAGIHVFGDGDVKLDVTNLQLEVVVEVLLSAPARIFLRKMTFLPSVENIQVEFTGLFDDPEQSQLVNELLNSVLTNWVNEKGQDISDLIEAILKAIINNAKPGEPNELEEDPSLIEIILNECKEDPPTTTTTEGSITTTTEASTNDCEAPVGFLEKINCDIIKALEEFRDTLEEPFVKYNIDLGPWLGVNWILDKLSLSGHTKFILNKVTTKLNMTVPGWGMTAEIDIPFSWKTELELDIIHNGEINVLDMNIKFQNSRIMGFLRNLDLFVYLAVTPYQKPKLKNLILKPTITQNDIKGVFSGIFVNGEDVSVKVTNFINNDLAKFMEKHSEDIGDIIAGLTLKLLELLSTAPSISDPDYIPAVDHLAAFMEQVSTILQQYQDD